MTALRVTIGLIWLLALLSGRGLWFSAHASSIAATSAEITAQSPELPGKPARASLVESDDSPAPKFDLFGNEVEDALADYRVDRGGGVYERHSPDTAVQKTGIPRT